MAAYEHAFKQAKHFVYIENQYWTSERLTKVLISQLKKNRDLYVVMLLPDKAEDPVVGKYIAGEQWFLLSQLWKSGGKSRVRAYVMYKQHPIKNNYVNVYVHSKIAIVDDLWATIGSANTNNRSMIIDMECNVQIAHRDAVKSFRKRAWKEIIGDTFGESDNAVSAIRSGWFPQGEKNKSLRQKGKELEGYIVPLSPPDEMKRVPKSIRLLL